MAEEGGDDKVESEERDVCGRGGICSMGGPLVGARSTGGPPSFVWRTNKIRTHRS